MSEHHAIEPSPVLSDEYLTAPHTVLARLRSEDPIHFVPVPGFSFWIASDETPRRLAEIEAKNKASVRLDQVDISSMFAANPNPAPAAPPAAAPAKK